MISEEFIPNPDLEAERLLAVEHALGEGGLIEKHLRFVATAESPSAEVSDQDYGYVPLDKKNMRPSNEPIDLRSVATELLGEPYDVPYAELASRINTIDSGWLDYIVEVDLVDAVGAKELKTAADEAYALDTNTEDNLPAYVVGTYGRSMYLAKQLGLELPHTKEWSRGIWPADEDGHLLTMNSYGDIEGILATRAHAAARTSQLRSGMEHEATNTIKIYAYTAWQELATFIAHSRNGHLFGPVGNAILGEVAADESRHHFVFMNILKELYNRFPEDTIRTVHSVLMPPLLMPGTAGIPNYKKRAVKIHHSGIFGIEQSYEAARSVLKKLGIFDESKTPEMKSSEAVAALNELRETYQAEEVEHRHRGNFVLGQTVKIEDLRALRKQYAQKIGLISTKAA